MRSVRKRSKSQRQGRRETKFAEPEPETGRRERETEGIEKEEKELIRRE